MIPEIGHFALILACLLALLLGVLSQAGAWRDHAPWMAMARPLACGQALFVALSLDPEHPQALDLAGSAAWEAGEFTLAAGHWTRLLTQIPAGSPRHLQLLCTIQLAEHRARFALPPPR